MVSFVYNGFFCALIVAYLSTLTVMKITSLA